jgi:hypothetical protein
MARHRSNLLLVGLRPKTLVVEMGQRSRLVLHILRTHRGHHHAGVLGLLERGCFLGGRWEVAASSSRDQLEGISQGRDNSGWRALLVGL